MSPLTQDASTSTQSVIFEFTNLDDFHGVLNLLETRKHYLYSEIRSFYNISDKNVSTEGLEGVTTPFKFHQCRFHFQEVHIEILVKNPPQNIDFGWERRMKHLFRYMLDLEKLMWNLSTLGGAYSAMGDFDTDYAKTAMKITTHQISLAKKYGDPVILARCYLYTALAEAQLGNLIQAVHIVRAVRHWSKQNPNTEIVQRCCEGVYQKLRAIHIFGTADSNKL
ncbi:Protein CBG10031 [Caenorhabditis briggsae]|uniref:Protein CBG10031 n=1 Tax=Caenorhabditis briggsae TaxID=6238 RepID=A8XA79_CAEBR|nr:Protein CBG10031 [Caenorhabditis briggsae]CAP29547.2 Protein CBG10031 [Caenorhabditis briggsae]